AGPTQADHGARKPSRLDPALFPREGEEGSPGSEETGLSAAQQEQIKRLQEQEEAAEAAAEAAAASRARTFAALFVLAHVRKVAYMPMALTVAAMSRSVLQTL